jgi:hypothetical protein
LFDVTQFRQGDLVVVTKGEHTGKYGRAFGFSESFPDFPGDPSFTFIGVDGAWAVEKPETERIPGARMYAPHELAHAQGRK